MAIDTSTFEYADSRLQDLYRHLKKCGYDVNFPGIKSGECKAPYIVIKNDKGGLSKNEIEKCRLVLSHVLCSKTIL